MSYLRENKVSPEPHSEYHISMLTSKIAWYDLFSGSCSEKTSRACKFSWSLQFEFTLFSGVGIVLDAPQN